MYTPKYRKWILRFAGGGTDILKDALFLVLGFNETPDLKTYKINLPVAAYGIFTCVTIHLYFDKFL